MDLGRSICAAHSFPNFTDIPHFDWSTKQNNLSSKYYKDGNNSNEALNPSISNVELNKTKKFKKVKDKCPVNNNFDDEKDKKQQEKSAVVAEDDGDNGEDKSSSDRYRECYYSHLFVGIISLHSIINVLVLK